MSETTVYLKNYQPPAFSISEVYLKFDLFDTHALVESRLHFFREDEGDLHLHGENLELISMVMNDKQLSADEYTTEDNELIIKNPPDKFILDIITRVKPQENTELSGLYRSHNLFCTQCEAEGFRRITYFLDRPDVLATYTTRITADKQHYPVLLSNGNLVDHGEGADGRHWAVWHDPFKKPSYLFALVAGNLAFIKDTFITSSGRGVDLRIYVEPGNEDKCSHAMESLKNSMRWDEAVYGREYDLNIFMIVAVSDFNMGAMENKGLNIFNSKYILARPDTATDSDYADIEGVVAHEYFHNWTGNRVTCRDWFQLSLKEGLTVFRDQEFSRDMNSRHVNRIMDVKVLRAIQFPEDAGSMAHPVRPESYQEINNFYTATIYNKGAEVIRMQHTLLGNERYRKGMDLYFERHDGQAVTIDDFVAAMEDANHFDLTQFKRWYSQAGTPQVEASSQFTEGALTVTLKQSCPPTPESDDKKPFHIPIKFALFAPNGELIPSASDVLELKDKEQCFVFSGLKERPVISLLREFSAPIHLEDNLSEEELLFLLRYETDGFAKWEAAQRLSKSYLKRCLTQSEVDCLPKSLATAFNYILLDGDLDMNLRAELLTPPGFEELISSLNEVDVEAVEQVRDKFRHQLGRSLFESALNTYEQLSQMEDHSMNGQAYGRRKLRNICLWLMMKANETEAMNFCLNQFKQAQTMTDQMAAFALLVNSKNLEVGAEAVALFYKQWLGDELVLDKWFAIQATNEHRDTLAQVKLLMKHPAFTIKNPNKVRALIGAFCQANPRNFHDVNGGGYQFLTDILITLDKINPQIAARLATPFTRWQRYDAPRRSLMLSELENLNQMDLSRDLKEVVSKSLVTDVK